MQPTRARSQSTAKNTPNNHYQLPCPTETAPATSPSPAMSPPWPRITINQNSRRSTPNTRSLEEKLWRKAMMRITSFWASEMHNRQPITRTSSRRNSRNAISLSIREWLAWTWATPSQISRQATTRHSRATRDSVQKGSITTFQQHTSSSAMTTTTSSPPTPPAITPSPSRPHQQTLAHTARTSLWEAMRASSTLNTRPNTRIKTPPNKPWIRRECLTSEAHISSLASPNKQLPMFHRRRHITTKNLWTLLRWKERRELMWS